MSFILALGGLSVLLAIGLALRLTFPLLGRLMLPVSLIAGFVGLAAGPHGLRMVPADVMAMWTTLPTILINIVFGALFLGAPVPALRAIVRTAGPLLRFSVMNAVGQYAVAMLLTWLLLMPVFGVHPLFACLIEVGFSGGHGSASAMGSVYSRLGFAAGGVLGQMSATVGILTGVIGGVVLIQWAARRGYTREVTADQVRGKQPAGLLPPASRRPIAMSTVSSVMIEPFTLHVAVTGLAVLIGWLLLAALQRVNPAFDGLPLFPLAMLGGMLLQAIADRTGAAAWLDRATFERLMGVSLDLLVTAAVASMRLDLFVQSVVPFTILMAVAIGWCVVSVMWFAPRMLRDDWFEQAIVTYGTQTGVAAVGLMLLRIVDPHNRTSAAQAFASRSIVISPLLGGGLITAAMPLLIVQFGLVPMLAACSAVTLGAWFWPSARRSAPESARG